MKPTYCGAKTRAGTPCRRYPITGRKRCKLHGGTNPGPGYGNQNAKTHGIYASRWTPEDHERAGESQKLIGTLDTEIELVRVRIARILDTEASGGYPDAAFHTLLDRYVGRLCTLETQRNALNDGGPTEQIITIRGGFPGT
ncbi:hypothetical protein F6A13_08205 [Acidithiobacillus sp. 'AMD consortium']|uniref:Uncharacterized protein n=1 Tax=Acidithiobacillus ferridurans TaxID=1232575 RepID=A0A2Z6IMH8_ACIFI|nr:MULTISPECIES: HGGxSTG domain-containing protein [Acidithiobacillus]QFG78626.1 hypothetical protein F6A13_08205 [Acidithiobacillus sp. 'AMD consortium']BBF66706.1 hypothetical protein AFERRID_29240 [Acidithiobacillus ferridurans]